MNPLCESDLDRLESLLESECFAGEAMLLDEVQALFCALASGPVAVPLSVWLPVVLGEHELPVEMSELQTLLESFKAQITWELENGAGVAPILYPVAEDSEDLDFSAWADAYLYATEMTEPAWHEAAGKHTDELGEMLQPLFLLSGALKEEAVHRGDAWLTPSEESRVMGDAQQRLPEVVLDIFNFWRVVQNRVETVRRDSPKVGRNDPCPCGSGKKFKQCCGA